MKRVAILATVFVFLITFAHAGTTITVGPGGSGAGYDYATIQDGINAAVNGDTVLVADGIYTGSGNRDIDFGGRAITVKSENGPETCVIDCQALGRGFYFHSGEIPDAVLNGLTIMNGNAYYGGGIACLSSSPTIINCILKDNNAKNGAGIYTFYVTCRPLITNCIFSNNSARHERGGLANYNSAAPILTNCLFFNNSANDNGGAISYRGGGGGHIMNNCTIVDNSAGNKGGGIYGIYSIPDPISCILWNNRDSGGLDASAQIDYKGYAPHLNFSCIQGWTGTTNGNMGQNPLFVDPEYNDYHLLPDSPCIDAGNPSHVADSNEADLDGYPRIIDGRIDMGAYETFELIKAQLHIQPRTINPYSNGQNITALITLPAEITPDQIDANEPIILYPGDIEATRQSISHAEGLTTVHAFFDRQDIINALPQADQVEFEAEGCLTTGQYFYGTDTIRILDKPAKPTNLSLLPAPIAHWTFDEGTGTTAGDSIGTNNGTLNGDPTWVAGKIGNYALDFDGSGDYVQIPDAGSLTPANQITIAYWIYKRSGQHAGIFKYASCPNESNSPGNSRAYIFNVNDSTSQVVFRVFSSTNNFDTVTSNNIVSPNQWHHIAVTFDHGNTSIYIDGQPDIASTMSVTSIMNDAQPLIIGGYWNYCGTDNFVSHLDGMVDDLRIYDVALTAEEIQTLYQAKPGKPSNGK